MGALAFLAGSVGLVVVLRFIPVPFSALMVQRRVEAWVGGKPYRALHRWTPLEEISPSMGVAVIAAEDQNFEDHFGFDWEAIEKAIAHNEHSRKKRGASTVSQQTAKNLFLWQGRSFVRKALEFPLALWINLVLPKRRVLEIYLNIAEWGPDGEFGAEAASRFAFGKAARELNPREAAELAAILPNPLRRSARNPSVMVRRLAGLYERRAAAHPAFDACIRPRGP